MKKDPTDRHKLLQKVLLYMFRTNELFVDLDLKSSQIIECVVLPVTREESGKLLTTSVGHRGLLRFIP